MPQGVVPTTSTPIAAMRSWKPGPAMIFCTSAVERLDDVGRRAFPTCCSKSCRISKSSFVALGAQEAISRSQGPGLLSPTN